jgi:hypothetical protein
MFYKVDNWHRQHEEVHVSGLHEAEREAIFCSTLPQETGDGGWRFLPSLERLSERVVCTHGALSRGSRGFPLSNQGEKVERALFLASLFPLIREAFTGRSFSSW